MISEEIFKDSRSGEIFFEGIVEKVKFENPENGYTVAEIKDNSTSQIYTITGNFPPINPGETIRIKGEWIIHKKFGRQIKVKDISSLGIHSPLSIKLFLASGKIKYIGEKTAESIVNHFGKDTYDILEKHPEKILEVEKIGKFKFEKIKIGWNEYKDLKELISFLLIHGISAGFSNKIYRAYGKNAIEIVKTNPYQLIYDIKGIGFKSADGIAEKLGEKKDSINRIKAGIIYLLDAASEEGHIFLPMDILVGQAQEILGVIPEMVLSGINKLSREKKIFVENENVYLMSHYEAEIFIADKIKRITKVPLKELDLSVIEGEIPLVEKKMGIKFAEKQKEAIKKAVNSKFFILTGGPGTGKTTIIRGMIEFFKKMKLFVALTAPTGRAAKRMEETCGLPAKTIHRLLEYKPNQGGFIRNESYPLKADVIIVDESSMMDVFIFRSLLLGAGLKTRIILVGDIDQLPSVGPGNVLKDLILSGKVEITQLKEIFRQDNINSIVLNAHRINSGDKIHIDNKKDENFFFIKEEIPEKIVDRIVDLCKRRLPWRYKCDPLNDIQVLTPMHKGDVGAINLNNVLQEVLNKNKLAIKRGNRLFKKGDKILQTKNNYEKDVYNGDIGIIKRIDIEESTVTVHFEGKYVKYNLSELDEITLAYAITVHKSQGSEYDIVLLPFSTQHFIMLQRNLLYTAVTRSKKVFIIIGTFKALHIAINNNKVAERFTSLRKKLQNA